MLRGAQKSYGVGGGGHSIEGGEFWNRDGALVNRECCPTFQFYVDQATSHCSCPHTQWCALRGI